MSVKRLNFTGRRRIPRKQVAIVVTPGPPRGFEAALHLDGMDFPEDAAVFVEATCAGSSAVQRFAFGTVGRLQAPARRTLEELDGERVFFAVKVVDRSERHGRILGIVEQVRPRSSGQADAGSESIFEVRTATIGQALWLLQLDGWPCLLLNDTVPDLKQRLLNDPLLRAAVLPCVVRDVLRAALENASEDDDQDGWRASWRRFGKYLHPNGEDPLELDGDAAEVWIDDVVAAFCDKHKFADAACKALGSQGVTP